MPTLQELQVASDLIGQNRLRTVLLEHQNTFSRLPAMLAEAQSWLSVAGVDHERLAERLELQLAAAAGWFAQHDLLEKTLQQQPRLQAFQKMLADKASASNLFELLKHAEMEVSLAQQNAKHQEEDNRRRIQRETKEAEELVHKLEEERIKLEKRHRVSELAVEKERQNAANAKRRRLENADAQAAAEKAKAERIVALGYALHGNGTVTDRKTGLMWKQDLEGKFFWSQAVRRFGAPGATRFAGHNDWRLPTMDELKSVLRPAPDFLCEEVFPDGQVVTWTSTKCFELFSLLPVILLPLMLAEFLLSHNEVDGEKPSLSDHFLLARYVCFYSGKANGDRRSHVYAVRLVRTARQ